MRITLARGAPVVSIYAGLDSEIMDATIDGKRVFHESSNPSQPGPSIRNWGLEFYALPAEDVEVVLKTQAKSRSIYASSIDRSYGLPFAKRRPENMIPTPYEVSDVTLVAKSFTY